MNEVDVYDIANSTWYRQATTGNTPQIRVNPCAVVAAAADGSSFNIYMFGGQNLIPAGNQTQYNDMWILSVPSFTWIPVSMDKQSVPYARAGHTCNIWDSQMIVVGGYIDPDISCEQPGVYVFNMSSLSWQNQFNALTQGKSGKGSDTFSQQLNQEGTNAESGLQGSYGYLVPQVVISAIGGDPTGGATITAPVASATSGPLASGHPITYTLTGPNGQIITETSTPGTSGGAKSGPNIGAIVAGVIAGVLFIVACYLGFCALVYRKQLQLYKSHVAAAQRAAANPNNAEKAGFFAPPGAPGTLGGVRGGGGQRSSGENSSRFGQSSSNAPSSGHKQSDSYGGQSSSSAGMGSGPGGYAAVGRTSNEGTSSSSEDLLGGLEPSFVGVVLHPRRSLRVVNRD
jgi:Kelch motif